MSRSRARRAASNGLEEEDKQPEDPAAKQKMRVYNTSLLSELLQEAEKARVQQAEKDEETKAAAQASTPPSRTVSLDPFQTQTDNLQKRIDRMKLLKYQEANRVMELTKKQLDKTMQRLQKQRDTTFQDRLDELQHGLASQDGIVAQVNGTLEQAAAVKHEKKAQLYSEWDQQVFQKIQGRINKGLSKHTAQELEQRLAKQYQDYLHTLNTKAGVFRDTIIESDYNPLEARQHTLRIPTGDIQDPVKRDLLKTQKERQLVAGAQVHVSEALGKPTLSTLLWDKLGSTPCGHQMDPTGDYIFKPLCDKELLLRQSHLVFDDYNYVTGRDIMMVENQHGGMRLKEGEDRRLFPVLQQTSRPYQEHHPQGDLWLQSMWKEGKGKVEGPEMQRGRADLAETLWQLSNPYKDGRSLGDQWMEARGKQRVPGPEMSRGRQGMFSTLQQLAEPVRSRTEATASGDRWIEDAWSKGKAVNAPQVPGHRQFADILQQTYDNPYRSSKAEEKVGDAWLSGRGKVIIPGAAGHESFYDPLPPGSGLYPAKRKEVPKNATSQLQQKGSLHPVKDKHKQKLLDAAASYLGDPIPL